MLSDENQPCKEANPGVRCIGNHAVRFEGTDSADYLLQVLSMFLVHIDGALGSCVLPKRDSGSEVNPASQCPRCDLVRVTHYSAKCSHILDEGQTRQLNHVTPTLDKTPTNCRILKLKLSTLYASSTMLFALASFSTRRIIATQLATGDYELISGLRYWQTFVRLASLISANIEPLEVKNSQVEASPPEGLNYNQDQETKNLKCAGKSNMPRGGEMLRIWKRRCSASSLRVFIRLRTPVKKVFPAEEERRICIV
ncbi:hypothetical protein CCUS01_06478 [Colletotrichum cuscutae]|uniref:Uncharacterized protein n=1 Tax=Colletotrichum cuscutae TaxID=1209917 RepID=A0AAI9Y3Q9_9PEZI|nr:hypothetical protein CCUS01_06478 [Colletotrichum cuscutae]